MKLITKDKISRFRSILLIYLCVSLCLSLKLKEKSQHTTRDPNNAGETFKFLFMYKHPQLQDQSDHKLNVFTYKNVLLTADELAVFESVNEADSVNFY